MNKIAIHESIIGTVRATFGAVPWIGTALNEVFFEIRARVKQQRLEDFVGELSERLKKIDQDKINIETVSDFFKLMSLFIPV